MPHDWGSIAWGNYIFNCEWSIFHQTSPFIISLLDTCWDMRWPGQFRFVSIPHRSSTGRKQTTTRTGARIFSFTGERRELGQWNGGVVQSSGIRYECTCYSHVKCGAKIATKSISWRGATAPKPTEFGKPEINSKLLHDFLFSAYTTYA